MGIEFFHHFDVQPIEGSPVQGQVCHTFLQFGLNMFKCHSIHLLSLNPKSQITHLKQISNAKCPKPFSFSFQENNLKDTFSPSREDIARCAGATARPEVRGDRRKKDTLWAFTQRVSRIQPPEGSL
jgi:hypothetical protein